MFCVGHGSNVNSEVLAAQRKHEKTLCVKKMKALFCKIVYKCFIDVSCMVQNHRKYRHIISAKNDKTLHFCSNLVSFCVCSTRFTRFGIGLGNTVNCDTSAPQRKHEKTLEFYTDYSLFCISNVFLICFPTYFLTINRVNPPTSSRARAC